VALLDRELEVDVETIRQDGRPKRTTIWVVVDDGEVFVRSWLGDRGHWYRHVLVRPDVTIHVAGKAVPARAVSATDDDSVERTTRGFQLKYPHSMSTAAMLAPAILHTTIRLEPR